MGKLQIILEPSLHGPTLAQRNNPQDPSVRQFGNTTLGAHYKTHGNSPATFNQPDMFRATCGRYWTTDLAPGHGPLIYRNRSSENPTGDPAFVNAIWPVSLQGMNENSELIHVPFEITSMVSIGHASMLPGSLYTALLADPESVGAIYQLGKLSNGPGPGPVRTISMTMSYSHEHFAMGSYAGSVPETLANPGYTNWRKYILGGPVISGQLAPMKGLFNLHSPTLFPQHMTDHVFYMNRPYDRGEAAYIQNNSVATLMSARAQGTYNYFLSSRYEMELDELLMPNSYVVYNGMNTSTDVQGFEAQNQTINNDLITYDGAVNLPTNTLQIHEEVVPTTHPGARPRPYLSEVARRINRVIEDEPEFVDAVRKKHAYIGISNNITSRNEQSVDYLNNHELYPMSVVLDFDSKADGVDFYSVLSSPTYSPTFNMVDPVMYHIMRADIATDGVLIPPASPASENYIDLSALSQHLAGQITTPGAYYQTARMSSQISTLDGLENINLTGYPNGASTGPYDLRCLDLFGVMTELHKTSPVGEYASEEIGAVPSALFGPTKEHGIINGYGTIVGSDVSTAGETPLSHPVSHIKFQKLKDTYKALWDMVIKNQRNWSQIMDGETAYVEPLLYKIIKYDENNNKLQTFYLPRSADKDSAGNPIPSTRNLNFADTQISHGKRYKYDVYEYNLVVGSEYRYRDAETSPALPTPPQYRPGISKILGYGKAYGNAWSSVMGPEDSEISRFHLAPHESHFNNPAHPAMVDFDIPVDPTTAVAGNAETLHAEVFNGEPADLPSGLNHFFLDLIEYDSSGNPIQSEAVRLDLGETLTQEVRTEKYSWKLRVESIESVLNNHPDLTYTYHCKYVSAQYSSYAPDGSPNGSPNLTEFLPGLPIHFVIATTSGIIEQGLESLFGIPSSAAAQVPAALAAAASNPSAKSSTSNTQLTAVASTSAFAHTQLAAAASNSSAKSSTSNTQLAAAASNSGFASNTQVAGAAASTPSLAPTDQSGFKMLWRTGPHGWEPDFIPSSEDGTATVNIDHAPSVKIYECPYYTTGLIQARDHAPSLPEVNVVPYRGNNRDILFLLNSPALSYSMEPIVIEPSDDEIFNELRNAHNRPTGPLVFKADDRNIRYQVYRTTQRPSSYSDFSGRLLTTVSSELEESKLSTGAALKDQLQSNTKYYYTFRAVDGHHQVSNPTAVYEIELVDEDGRIFPIIKTIEFEGALPTLTKPLKKYLSIAPALSQRMFNAEQIPTTGSAGDPEYQLEHRVLGVESDSIWAPSSQSGPVCDRTSTKTYKIRVTSKSTGKKLDLNIKFTESSIVNPEHE